MKITEDSLIHTNSGLTEDFKPCVVWRFLAHSGRFTLTEARTKAMGLLHAVAIAQTEDAIATMLTKDLSPKGFGSEAIKEKEETNAKVLMLLRHARPPLVEGVEPIHGYYTKEPLINIYWYGEGAQLNMNEATFHAEILLRTAEVAESDAFLRFFLLERGGSLEEGQLLIEEFTQYRIQQRLEQLF